VTVEQARTPASGMAWSSSPEALAEVEGFKDGQKLQSLVDKLDNEVFPAFGKGLVKRRLVTEARGLAKTVTTRRAAAILALDVNVILTPACIFH
jgi:hypothetical protein